MLERLCWRLGDFIWNEHGRSGWIAFVEWGVLDGCGSENQLGMARDPNANDPQEYV
jgi:hypothetical protein